MSERSTYVGAPCVPPTGSIWIWTSYLLRAQKGLDPHREPRSTGTAQDVNFPIGSRSGRASGDKIFTKSTRFTPKD
jgi:hypothetical protein